jgi:acyltransferase-like protein
MREPAPGASVLSPVPGGINIVEVVQRASAVRPPATGRLPQLDTLKAVLIAWIIGGHALLGYSALGGWEYDQVREVTFRPRVEFVLTAALGPSALVVIGAFFFLAGLFVPGALARRGLRGFVLDRVVRLGLPYLLYVALLWPGLLWLTHLATGQRMPLRPFYEGGSLLDSGPLWFAGVLLVFSVAYAALAGHTIGRPPHRRRLHGWHLVALAAGITVLTFMVRLWLPASGPEPVDLHLWQWPQCAAMFGLGIAHAHGELVRHVPDGLRRACGLIALIAVLVALSVTVLAGVTELGDNTERFLGGWSWQALGTAAFEGILVVTGSVWLLGAAQRRFTATSQITRAGNRGAYDAYLLQAPILFGFAIAARPLPAPAEIKAILVAVTSITACFTIGWLLVDRTRFGRVL